MRGPMSRVCAKVALMPRQSRNSLASSCIVAEFESVTDSSKAVPDVVALRKCGEFCSVALFYAIAAADNVVVVANVNAVIPPEMHLPPLRPLPIALPGVITCHLQMTQWCLNYPGHVQSPRSQGIASQSTLAAYNPKMINKILNDLSSNGNHHYIVGCFSM